MAKKKDKEKTARIVVLILLGIAALIVIGSSGIYLFNEIFTAEKEAEEPKEPEEPEEAEIEFFLDGIRIEEEELRRRVAQERVGPLPFYRTKGEVVTWQEIVGEIDENLVDIIFDKILDLHDNMRRADLDYLLEKEDRVDLVTIPKGTYRINTFLRHGKAKEGRGRATQNEIALSWQGKPILLVRCLNPVKLIDPPPPAPAKEEDPEPERKIDIKIDTPGNGGPSTNGPSTNGPSPSNGGKPGVGPGGKPAP